MTPKTAPTWRRVVVGALPVALGVLLLGVCLFGDCPSALTSRALGSTLAEVTAVLSDAGTQWMVFAFAGVYFLRFLVLRRHSAAVGGNFWLLGLLVVVG